MNRLLLLLVISLCLNLTAQTPGGGVTDIDGNNYSTVIISNQEWMAENLRVSRYSNGDSINYEPVASNWQFLSSGAFSWYNNNPGYDQDYGKLYNWFACVDSRNVCPSGWQVPSIENWQELVATLGGNSAGDAMKDTTSGYWIGAAGATNSSGFTGLPGGHLSSSGSYFNQGFWGQWWSSTESVFNNSSGDCMFLIGNFPGALTNSPFPKVSGLSVRCLKVTLAGIEIIELNDAPKTLIKIVDLTGRETEYKPNTPLIFIYSDGTRERVMKLEK